MFEWKGNSMGECGHKLMHKTEHHNTVHGMKRCTKSTNRMEEERNVCFSINSMSDVKKVICRLKQARAEKMSLQNVFDGWPF